MALLVRTPLMLLKQMRKDRVVRRLHVYHLHPPSPGSVDGQVGILFSLFSVPELIPEKFSIGYTP